MRMGSDHRIAGRFALEKSGIGRDFEGKEGSGGGVIGGIEDIIVKKL